MGKVIPFQRRILLPKRKIEVVKSQLSGKRRGNIFVRVGEELRGGF